MRSEEAGRKKWKRRRGWFVAPPFYRKRRPKRTASKDEVRRVEKAREERAARITEIYADTIEQISPKIYCEPCKTLLSVKVADWEWSRTLCSLHGTPEGRDRHIGVRSAYRPLGGVTKIPSFHHIREEEGKKSHTIYWFYRPTMAEIVEVVRRLALSAGVEL